MICEIHSGGPWKKW